LISALQSSAPVLPSRPEAISEKPAPAAAVVRPEDARQERRFAEQRGTTVSGGTLIAAQEEAGKPRKPAEEEAPKPEKISSSGPASELSEADKERVGELQARDREVRAHEQAHARVGGQHAGSPQYEFERGPDGQSYAVGGHVSISTSPVPGDPAATVRKMEQVKRAALAPAEPSGPDRRVAANADAKRADARAELSEVRREEMKAAFEGTDEPDAVAGSTPADEAKESGQQTFGDGETTPIGRASDPILPPGSQPTDDEDGEGDQSIRFAGIAAEQDNGFGQAVSSDAAARSPFAQQIESFSRTLERGLEAASSFTGGIGQLDMGSATRAEAETTTRRTGVDIRV
jgi:hypothetical protein